MRHYVVLQRVGPPKSGQWREVTALEARSREHALRQVEQAGVPRGEYMAIELAHWRVVQIPVRQ